MNAQFKKGVLELIVLAAVEQKDMYGYELVAEVSKVVNVKEGMGRRELQIYCPKIFLRKERRKVKNVILKRIKE